MMQIRNFILTLALILIASSASWLQAETPDELKVKRESVFKFASKPEVSRAGDRIIISFESKGACDVTVAVQDKEGKIVRHLASGVLGKNAPSPFKSGTLKQTLEWDGKDDQGRYVDNKENLVIRVSLGLKPMYERDLLRSDKKRFSQEPSLIVPRPEGVYVYDGGAAMDFLRLYDHNGNYLRTVYPFPADKIEKVKGLIWHTAIQDGTRHPVKGNYLQNTMLTSGTNSAIPLCYNRKLKRYTSAQTVNGTTNHYGMYGRGVMSMAVRDGRIALANWRLNRLGTDGSSGGMALNGPLCSIEVKNKYKNNPTTKRVPPNSMAISPDGKTLYLTGYVFPRLGDTASKALLNLGYECFHGVFTLSMNSDEPLKLFVGSDKRAAFGPGKGKGQFNLPTCVAVDDKGLVYVGDYLNDRVQVFKPDGSFVRSFPVKRPAQITLDLKRDELYVSSFLFHNESDRKLAAKSKVPAQLIRFKGISSPKKTAVIPVPTIDYWNWSGRYRGHPLQLSVIVDTHASEPVVWVSEGYQRDSRLDRGRVKDNHIRLYTIKGNKLVLKQNFNEDVKKSVARTRRPRYARQRLAVNPKNGRLYIAEGDSASFSAFKALLEADPETGRVKLVDIPFDAEDFCFDNNGFGYLRSMTALVRYNASDWREIPWDYGEEREKVHTSSSSDRKVTSVISAIILPIRNSSWHQGGMYVDLNGNVAVTCGWDFKAPATRREDGKVYTGSAYKPTMFPGRSTRGRGGMPIVHIFNKHGKVVRKDAVPGVSGNTYGLGLDKSGAITAMVSDTRIYNGKEYYNDLSGTLIKFRPEKARIISGSTKKGEVPLPLTEGKRPKRPKDIRISWVEGAEWFYGGVGWDGKNAGIGCGCWNARFTYDYFNRSFAPELDRYRVAVLDGAGNLILRVGQYGNADSTGPKSRVPLGGDEVGLVHGAYLATHTDKRLFIADPANERIVSVKLNYHTEEKIPLGNIADMKNKK